MYRLQSSSYTHFLHDITGALPRQLLYIQKTCREPLTEETTKLCAHFREEKQGGVVTMRLQLLLETNKQTS